MHSISFISWRCSTAHSYKAIAIVLVKVRDNDCNIIEMSDHTCTPIITQESSKITKTKSVLLTANRKFVYKIPYRRALAWPSGCIGQVRARAKESCIQTESILGALYSRYLCSRDALGLSARDDRVSCIQLGALLLP